MARNGPTPPTYGYSVRGLPGMLGPTHQEPVPPGDAHAEQRAGHRVETGRVDDRVDLVLLRAGADAARGDLLDRYGPRVQQCHVVPVEGLVVAVLQRRPLGEERVILGRQQFRDGRIRDDLADL